MDANVFERGAEFSPAQWRALAEIAEALVAHRDVAGLLHELRERLKDVVPFDELGADLHEPSDQTMRLFVVERAPEGQLPGVTRFPIDEIPTGEVWKTQQPLLVPDVRTEPRWRRFFDDMASRTGARSFCFVPTTTGRRRLGTLGFLSHRTNAYAEADLPFLSRIGGLVAVAVENALAFRQIEQLSEKLKQEKVYLEGELSDQRGFGEIVGASAALRRALQEVRTVAPTDATVLLCGETGTGKELVARAIHLQSGRRERAFVKLNCAAIPTGLLESELFGHEKGAFTGAIAQKSGRFELAHQGTLFLDEIGDIPLELQPKLLRVLQDQEFERLGGVRTLRTDVRVIAATNRELGAMVSAGAFRGDLFYRLNVFPVRLPPLRERREDISGLVRHFTQRFAKRMGKKIETIPAETLAALTDYVWPGNIRELQNLIERAAILSEGPELCVPLGELRVAASTAKPGENGATLAAAEREHILKALADANWVLGGPRGAAARLGLKRTSLQWKMKKLGIERPS